MWTAGIEPALSSYPGTKQVAIEVNHFYRKPTHSYGLWLSTGFSVGCALRKTLCHCWLSCFVITALGNSPIPFRASTITSIPAKDCCWRRKLSRINRLIRLRWTARRTCFFAMTKPRRGRSRWLARASTRKCWCDARKGASLKTLWKSLELSRRSDFPNAHFTLTTHQIWQVLNG